MHAGHCVATHGPIGARAAVAPRVSSARPLAWPSFSTISFHASASYSFSRLPAPVLSLLLVLLSCANRWDALVLLALRELPGQLMSRVTPAQSMSCSRGKSPTLSSILAVCTCGFPSSSSSSSPSPSSSPLECAVRFWLYSWPFGPQGLAAQRPCPFVSSSSSSLPPRPLL